MKVLVVVDMQHDFVDGVLGTPEAQAIVPNVAMKVARYRGDVDSVILYTRDTHYDNYLETLEGKNLPVPHCIYGTKGWEIVPEVYIEGDTAVVDKHTFGCHNIANHVQALVARCYESLEIDSIEIVGLCTDICVVSNALILKSVFTDIPIIVDSACCAGTSPSAHEKALDTMMSCQIEVR